MNQNQSMNAPEEIYAMVVACRLFASREPNEVFGKQFPKYIREDVVNDKIAHFEDHAYFAGQENMREDMKKWAQGRLKHYQELLNSNPAEREYMALVGAYQAMIDKLERI